MSDEKSMPFEEDLKFLTSEVSKNFGRWNNYQDMLEGKYANRRGVTPYEVVYQKNRFRIIRYLSQTPKRFKTPAFCVCLINRLLYSMILTEDKSLYAIF